MGEEASILTRVVSVEADMLLEAPIDDATDEQEADDTEEEETAPPKLRAPAALNTGWGVTAAKVVWWQVLLEVVTSDTWQGSLLICTKV